MSGAGGGQSQSPGRCEDRYVESQGGSSKCHMTECLWQWYYCQRPHNMVGNCDQYNIVLGFRALVLLEILEVLITFSKVFLPGESQGWGSLVGCRPWGLTKLDTTEAT